MIITNISQLQNLQKSGNIAKIALKTGIEHIRPGISTFELDKVVHDVILANKGLPAFLGYDNGDGIYPFTTCVCINHELVHTLPSKKRIIQKGDIVTIDLGVIYKGYYTDTSHTIEVESNVHSHFLTTGIEALDTAISLAKTGNYIGDMGYAMQSITNKSGYSVSVDLVGHGIGKKLHESPQVPCYGKKKTGLVLKENMVLAVEIMYMQGKNRLVMSKDGFGIETYDKSISAQFEHTIVVTKKGPIILV